jgi:hypothetical protein
MKNTRIRLLLLTALLTGTALLSAAPPAESQCFRYCWHVSAEESCCRTRTCEIICG